MKGRYIFVAAINDLIAQIEDKSLRERLEMETDRITKGKKFGLVFEEHLPELTPLYRSKLRKGSVVAQRGKTLSDLWRIQYISDDWVYCLNHRSGEKRQFSIDELMVVSQFGEPIFPTLVPVNRVQNGSENAPWHILIESDNYHALQLLEYMYAEKVDCIYIDPPYNTGAKDWKYNNDYVDETDNWRHSKWLSMMQKRLKLAKRLLKPETGVLIVTIDEHEVHHLRVLLQQIFPNAYIQMVTAVINPKGVTQGRFSRVEEYLIYCFMPNAYVQGSDDPLLGEKPTTKQPRWKGLLRSGTNARREDSKNQFYPVLIDVSTHRIVKAGNTLPFGESPKIGEKIDGYALAWPIRDDLSEGNWGVSNVTLNKLIEKGYVALGKYDDKRKTWGISYLSKKPQQQVESGELKIISFDEQRQVVSVAYTETPDRQIKTVWYRNTHDAGAYGSDLVSGILGFSRAFSFPKSLYAVRDAIATVVRNNKEALILDFFAGSGTTLDAVNLLNAVDNGNRRCILVTNNEVSDADAKLLTVQGYRPGDKEWEKLGICQSVTWPRIKSTISGKRDDGSDLEGFYISGKNIEKEKSRKFQQIGFTTIDDLNTASKKKQLVALIDGIPQSAVKKDTAFIISEKHNATILFDASKIDDWLTGLEDQEHITDFYIVTDDNSVFYDVKNRITDLLGHISILEEEKRPMGDGFISNLEYFRLEFLDKDRVALGRQFREILPILWLKSGAIGPRPELPKNKPIPAILFPEHNSFAVLVNEKYFADFISTLELKSGITHVYLVTDSDDSFKEMAVQISVPFIVQLYRDYLENFVINKGENM